MADITAANGVFNLTIPSILAVAQTLQGWSADDAFTTEAIEPVEVVMGIDGYLSAAYQPKPYPQEITLQADSPSLVLFETWAGGMRANKQPYFATGVISLPAISRVYTLTNGVLTSYTPIPDVKKMLQPVKFKITWESIIGAAL